MPPGQLPLDAISLRRGERMLLGGGTGSGKSTLEDVLILDFHDRYLTGRQLILDTKPRFRAEWDLTGVSAKWRYRHWDHGTVIPGSVLVHEPRDLAAAWRLGFRIAIAQTEAGAELARLCAIARGFYMASRASRPQLLTVDEMMDFYTPQAAPRAGTDNTLILVVRAGRERGMAALYAAQRLAGYPPQILELITKVGLFRLDMAKDIKRLPECGAPLELVPPEDDWVFNYWTKLDRRHVYGPYRLAADAVR